MALHNKYNRQELRLKIQSSSTSRKVLSFYRYFKIEEPNTFRNKIYRMLSPFDVLGRIYVAAEGINAQISVPLEHLESMKTALAQLHPELEYCLFNEAVENKKDAFILLKIKVRKKIVADGIEDETFNPNDKGFYLTAEDFNRLSDNEKTTVVDMRNHYEYEVGRFENAVTYLSDTFREQVPGTIKMLEGKENDNIILYCTGGIRCEKFSAYLKHQGFQNVFHLKGGIIHYAQQVKEKKLKNKFKGKNFVFDERLGEKIGNEIIAHCHQCGKPADTHINCSNEACHLLFIQCNECKQKFNACCSEHCKEILSMSTEQRKQLRKGLQNGQKIFNKSREVLHERFGVV